MSSVDPAIDGELPPLEPISTIKQEDVVLKYRDEVSETCGDFWVNLFA